MLKIIKQSKLWFYIPFAIFRMKKVKQMMQWVMEPNDYHEALRRDNLMSYIVWLNFLYLIVLIKLIFIIL